MTAITHVCNYTVRCPHYKDPEHEVTWKNHVEINKSCEIALNRITKWHGQHAIELIELNGLAIRKAEGVDTYFSVRSDRLKDDGHILVTFKILMDDCDDNTCLEDIVSYLAEDYEKRLAKLK
ncbi:cytoplasmic protein [Shewanella gelidii]|uniref:Cytoplasmic protein n=1 Tax=Shewanella gelidii TaxID=1642821 RepID=A0A917JLF1_9GAMM|nr:cytoplasmic protein [Shewanella gelidii]MCL1097217.1 cytoplasmic protein [Shewanella gelidii]GGI73363.1 hypothetical protein GCM10009332_08620 [Shewanella gelidii]